MSAEVKDIRLDAEVFTHYKRQPLVNTKRSTRWLAKPPWQVSDPNASPGFSQLLLKARRTVRPAGSRKRI